MSFLKNFINHITPHKGNNFAPRLFAAEAVMSLFIVVGLVQAGFIVNLLSLKNSDYFAAVLPGVLVTLTNQDRDSAGKGVLEFDALLAQAAQAKADDMAKRGYFAHVDPDGRQPWYWLDKVGYTYAYAGENLAVDFSESDAVAQAWMQSPAHKANILNQDFTEVGIGVAKGVYQGRETTFVVQFFASPAIRQITAPTVARAATIPTTVDKPESYNQEPPEVKVLGVETTKEQQVSTEEEVAAYRELKPEVDYSTKPNKLETLIASPSAWALPLLVLFFVLVGIAFVVSVITHLSVARVEGLVSALFVLLVLGGIILMDSKVANTASVPNDTQYASINMVFDK